MTAQAAPNPAAIQQKDGQAREVFKEPKSHAQPVNVAESQAPVEISRAFRDGIERWLDWQCRMVVGVYRGTVYVADERDGDGLLATAMWPRSANESAVMAGYAQQSLGVGRSVLHKAADDQDPSGEVRDFVAFPVKVGGRVLGIVTLALEIRSEVQRQAVVQLLEWGSVWLEDTLLGLRTDRREDAQLALQLISTLSDELPLPVSAHRACNLLADTFGCSSVALGMLNGMQVRISALSHQVQFDHRQDSLVRVQAAMEECVDQEELVCVPGTKGTGTALVRAHQRLLELPEAGAACSVPILTEDFAIGALTLIWDTHDAVDSVVTSRVTDIARQFAPVLALKQRESKSLWRRLTTTLRNGSGRLFGAGHLKLKVTTATAVAALVALSTIQTDARIAADSVVEGSIQQAVVAPINGFLLAAGVRAGDQVQKDQVLAAIDDRELVLEKQKWQSERDKHAKEYQEALGTRDRAKLSIASARMAQAEAELKLVAEQLERIRVRAPFSGTLVSGDLSRAIGAPLERGQVLFEIVPNDNYRVSLQVDEHDIANLKTGQVGDLRLTGLPGTPIEFEVSRIVPLATADRDGNRFRVEAKLGQLPTGLRPGMQGVAKVVTGRTSLLHAWTDELVSRLRFWIWSLGY